MKIRIRTIIFLTLLLAVLLAGTVIFTELLGPALFDLGHIFNIGRTRDYSFSSVVLQDMREIFTFHTVEFVYKAVFPHDYMDKDVSIESIMQTLRSGNGKIEDLLSQAERQYLEVYKLAKSIGIDIEADPFDFVVLTVIVRGGFDLSGTVYEEPGTADREEIAQWITVLPPNPPDREGRGRVIVRLPEAEITDIYIEDETSVSYNYPDIRIDPDGWKRLTDYVRRKSIDKILKEGILEIAASNAQSFLTSFLHQAGYGSVEFRNKLEKKE
jgi:hypothetical protein